MHFFKSFGNWLTHLAAFLVNVLEFIQFIIVSILKLPHLYHDAISSCSLSCYLNTLSSNYSVIYRKTFDNYQCIEICVYLSLLNSNTIPYRKNFGDIKVWRIRTVGSFLEKNFGKVKSICIGDVMKIVKSGKNLAKCCNLPKLFTVQ